MKIQKLFLLFLPFILFASRAVTQDINDVNSPVKKGPEGVYFFTGLTSNNTADFFRLYKKYEKFEGQFSNSGENFKTVTVITEPKTYEEFEKRISKETADSYKKVFKVKNNDSLLFKIKAVNQFSVFLFMDKNFSEAMGVIGYAKYLSGKPKAYRLVGIAKGGQPEVIYTINDDGKPAPELPKPALSKYLINDSVVTIEWSVPYKYAGRAVFADVFKKDGEKFEKLQQALLGNIDGDSVIKYKYTESVNADHFYNYYITVEDFGGNMGPSSDTVNSLAVSARQIKSIKNFKLVESKGGIHLSWNGIPDKGYFSAVEISKSRMATKDYVVIDIIPITDTTFEDRKIVAGTQYYYKIKALAYPFANIKALPSAMATINVENKSSKPFAPTALAAKNEDKNIRLSWEDNPELDLYAYFVYRGTNANNMQQVSGIIQGNTWLDSSSTLSGLTTYAYSLKVMNRGQMMSDASQPVYIKPARATQVPAIGGLTGLKRDAGYQLRWENIADNFTSVTGYILLRKASNEKEFFPVAPGVIEGALYTDSSQLLPGIKYEYTVAAIDYNGSVGELSPSVYYEPTSTYLKPPSTFTVFTESGKIKIKWPQDAGKTLNKKVNVYRKSSTEKTFKLIGTSGDDYYTDEKVVSNTLYTYSLSVSLNNLESEKSTTQSVRAK